MHKLVWISFGLLALVGCGSGGTTNDGSNPTPGNPGGSDSTRDPVTTLTEEMMLSQLDDNNNWIQKCSAGSTMWANVCYPAVHVEMDGISKCSNSYGEICEGTHNPSVKIWLGDKSNANVLFAIGSEVSPLLKKMRWKLVHRKGGRASWSLKGTSVTLMPPLITTLITTDDGSNELTSQKVLNVGAFTLSLTSISNFRVVDSSKYSCPVNGTLKINGVEGALSVSDEDIKKIWPKEYDVSEENRQDVFHFTFGFPRNENCTRLAETGLDHIQYDSSKAFLDLWQ